MLISRKRSKIETYFQWKINRKSYVAYQTAPVLVTLNDHSPVAGLFKCNPLNIYAAFYQISTDVLMRSLSDILASCVLMVPVVADYHLIKHIIWDLLFTVACPTAGQCDGCRPHQCPVSRISHYKGSHSGARPALWLYEVVNQYDTFRRLHNLGRSKAVAIPYVLTLYMIIQ